MRPEMKKILIIAVAVVVLLVTGTVVGSCDRNSSEGVAAPTAAPAVEASTEPEHIQGQPVDESWFSDAVFVGDSVTLKLSYYCDNNPDALGGAQFFCAGSLGYGNALWDIDDPSAVHPFYKGANHLAEESAELTGAKKVFIMLGMNDIALYGIDGAISYADELFGRILARTPDVQLYVQSVTPILSGHEIGDWNNENIREFNSRLSSYCTAHKYTFIDLYSVMADETGYLRSEYCGDPDAQGVHFTDVACMKWIETLKNSV